MHEPKGRYLSLTGPRRFIGDLSQPDLVLLKLELAVAEPEEPDATDLAT